MSQPSGPALVAAAADADPVTLLITAWLSTRRSANTRAAYARDIGIAPPRRPGRAPSWLDWCQQHGVHPVSGVTALHVTQYARQLHDAGLSPASTARKLAAISSWYGWLARRGHITASPAAGIARPRPGPPTSPAPALTPDQALALMHAADTAPGPQRARTAALISVLLYTSARVSEVTGADVADLGTSGGRRVLWVTRANSRRQGLPLPGPAASRIDAYLAGRAEQALDQALFATRTGRRLFAADIRQTVSRIATQAGLPADQARHLGPRMIRRSFTTLYLQASESLRGLHSSSTEHSGPLATTRRYQQARHTLASHARPATPQPHKLTARPHPGDQARDPDPGQRPQSRPHCGARPRRAARQDPPRLSSPNGRHAGGRHAGAGSIPGSIPVGPYLDLGGPGERMPGRYLDRRVQIGAVDDGIAADLLFRLRERAVGDQQFAVSHLHDRGFRRRAECAAAKQNPALGHLFHPRLDGDHHGRIVFCRRLAGLVDPEHQHALHGLRCPLRPG